MVRDWLPRPIEQELALCMRYFEKSTNVDTIVTTATNLLGLSVVYVTVNAWPNQAVAAFVPFKVKKRATPTVNLRPYTTPTNTSRVSLASTGADQAANSGTPVAQAEQSFYVYNNSGGGVTDATQGGIIFHWDADAEL